MKNWQIDFVKWLEKGDHLFTRFSQICESTELLFKKWSINHDESKTIAKNLHIALYDCDNLTFNEEGTGEAYIFWHFLDRYRRFQMIYLKLITHKLFPIKNSEIKILDIGTGPAPSLFALNDIYSLLELFAEEKDLTELKGLKVRYEFIERSDTFIRWIGNFQELLFSKSDKTIWKFLTSNLMATDLEGFNGTSNYSRYENNKFIKDERHHIYDLIIMSNFLTNLSILEKFENEISNATLYMRNKGIILLAGGLSSNEKYKPIYDKVTGIFKSDFYNTDKYYGKFFEVKIHNSTMSFRFDNVYYKLVKKFLSNIYKLFIELDLKEQMPSEAIKIIEKSISEEYRKQIYWEIKVFKRFSRVKDRYIEKKNFERMNKIIKYVKRYERRQKWLEKKIAQNNDNKFF